MRRFIGVRASRGPLSPPTTEKRERALATSTTRFGCGYAATARSAKRARRGSRREHAREGSDLGQLGALPVEILELVLLQLNAKELGRLATTCRYFNASGIVERVATALLPTAPRADMLCLFPQDSRLKAMHHCEFSERAERAAASLSLGAHHSACLIDKGDGTRSTIATFGRGFHGQLGQGGFESSHTPVYVEFSKSMFYTYIDSDDDEQYHKSFSHVDSISLGGSHNVALTDRGEIASWGLASSGECGHLGWTPIEEPIPRLVCGVLTNARISSISAGASHTLAVSVQGELFSCGRGRSGQLGHGHFQDAGPMRRLQALNQMRVVSAVAGGSHSMCITANGSVWAWGNCRYGQLGLGDLSFAAAAGWFQGVPWPCLVEALNEKAEPVVQMAAGGYHSMFVTSGGRLYVCGRGKHGALGLARAGASSIPPTLSQLTAPLNPRTVANRLKPELVWMHHFVRGGDGTVVANRVQQCSCGTACRVALAAAGTTHSVVLTSCGAVFTTGENSYGQLGHGHLNNGHTFTRVEALRGKNVTAVAAGHNHTGAIVECAVEGATRLYMWGRGDWGQLGTGEGRSYSVPRLVDSFRVAPPLEEHETRAYQQCGGYFSEEDECECGECVPSSNDDMLEENV